MANNSSQKNYYLPPYPKNLNLKLILAKEKKKQEQQSKQQHS
jgi:hypothetical protein